MNHMNSLNTYVERYKEVKHSIVFVSVIFIFLILGNKKGNWNPKVIAVGEFPQSLGSSSL